jgi:hypothetical protein
MSKSGPALRAEIDGVWYLEAHPEVAEFFKHAGAFSYCEKLTNFRQQVAESFSISYDGRYAKIGKEDFIIDEVPLLSIHVYPSQGTAGLNQLFLQILCLGHICCLFTKILSGKGIFQCLS